MCKAGGDPVYTHNSITDLWAESMKFTLESQSSGTRSNIDSNDILNITLLDHQAGKILNLDITVVHPWCRDALPKTTREDEAAAARRLDSKDKSQSRESCCWSSCLMQTFGT